MGSRMVNFAVKDGRVSRTVEEAVRDLLQVRHWGDSSFISLPLIYPSGAFVTVKVDQSKGGFLVSDNGFAYREVEALGAQRSFSKTAQTIAGYDQLSVGKRVIFVEGASETELVRAVCDVAKAS